ncbi:MAG: TetR/AcrR family transcriptional regulator [Myxococcota bacterium]
MGNRRYDPEATRQAILEAAKQVFVEQGVADTPLSEVAKAAGVTKSLIHHHFGSKEELWNEVKRTNFKRYFGPILETIQGDQNNLDALRAVIEHMFMFLRDNPDVARMMGWMALEKDEINVELQDQVCTQGLDRIARGQAEGALRSDIHPASIMSTFIILTGHWWHFRHITERWKDMKDAPAVPQGDALDMQFFEDMMKIFMEGVSPR